MIKEIIILICLPFWAYAGTEKYPDLPDQPESLWDKFKNIFWEKTYGQHRSLNRWLHWYLIRMMKYFELMTEEINKQVFQKLQHAEKYVELDEDTTVYMMGKMSEAMKERFRTMILLYRYYTKYSDMPSPLGRYHVIARQLAALQEVEGEYNRLLYERRLYHKAMQDFYEELTASSQMLYEATKQREDDRNRRANGRTPQVRDEDYKLQLRRQKFEEKRASFNPEVEGIDVDLGDMV